MMMMMIIMTSLGFVSRTCCSCFDPFNYNNLFLYDVASVSGYPYTDFYIFKTFESWESLRIRSAFSSTF